MRLPIDAGKCPQPCPRVDTIPVRKKENALNINTAYDCACHSTAVVGKLPANVSRAPMGPSGSPLCSGVSPDLLPTCLLHPTDLVTGQPSAG